MAQDSMVYAERVVESTPLRMLQRYQTISDYLEFICGPYFLLELHGGAGPFFLLGRYSVWEEGAEFSCDRVDVDGLSPCPS